MEEWIMKCENCGKNEVSFVYQSNINGKREEKHLCADWRPEAGYADGHPGPAAADDAGHGEPL